MSFKTLYITLLILSSSSILRAQVEMDSVKRILIEPKLDLTFIDPWPPRYPFIVADLPYQSEFLLTPAFYKLECGEERFPNGGLMIRVPCKNGKPHGKVVYWNVYGQITSTYIYRYGRVYTTKQYQNGYLTSVAHYKYDKAGRALNHGKFIDISGDQKTIRYFKLGSLHGLMTITNGESKKTVESYSDGLKEWTKIWYDEQLTSETYYDSLESITLNKTWDRKGNLLSVEHYENGKPIGTWSFIKPYHVLGPEKTIRIYSEEGIVSEEVYYKDIRSSKRSWQDGVLDKYVAYYKNGQPSSEQKYTGNSKNYTYRGWNKNGIQTSRYIIAGDQYVGKGYIRISDSVVHYIEASLEPNDYLPLVKWVILNGDTTDQQFIVNSLSNPFQFLETNKYAQNSAGHYVKNGIWKTYLGNYIESVVTYNLDTLDGRAVYYSQNNGFPKPSWIGYFTSGKRSGKWRYLSDTIVKDVNYLNGVKHGDFTQFHRSFDTVYTISLRASYNDYPNQGEANVRLDTIATAFYINDELHGGYRQFDLNGNCIELTSYINGKKHGDYFTYYSNGHIKRHGKYKNGSRAGRWFEWQKNDNGKWKKEKLHLEGNQIIF